MKKIVMTLIITMMILGSLAAQPAAAAWTATLGYGTGDTEVDKVPGPPKQSTDLDGVFFGLDYTGERFGAGFFLVDGDMDDGMGFKYDDDFSLRELYASVNLYRGDSGRVYLALGNLDLQTGSYEIDGVLAQLAGEYKFSEHWSIDGGIGIGIDTDITDDWIEYDSNSLRKLFVDLNYQLNEHWRFKFGYLNYRYDGEPVCKGGKEYTKAIYDEKPHPICGDLTGETQLFIIGIGYTFGGPKPEPPVVEEPPTPEPPKPEPPKPEPPKPEPPKPEPPKPEPPKVVEVLNQFLEPIFFDFDKSDIRPDQLPKLEKALEILQENKDLSFVLVAGHADPPGTNEYNQSLSERRAKVIADWLIEHGIDASRITEIGYGEENLYMAESNDPSWESDRWVDIVLTNETPRYETGLRK